MKPDEENLDFLNWLAESRQDHLSQTGILSSEEYMTEDLTALLGHEPTPDEKADRLEVRDKAHHKKVRRGKEADTQVQQGFQRIIERQGLYSAGRLRQRELLQI